MTLDMSFVDLSFLVCRMGKVNYVISILEDHIKQLDYITEFTENI